MKHRHPRGATRTELIAAALAAAVLTGCASTGGVSAAASGQPHLPATAATQPAAAEAPNAAAAPRPAAAPAGQPRPFAEVVKDARRTEGFITTWQKDEKVWLELRPDQLDKPFLFSTVLSRGIAQLPFVPGLLGNSEVAVFRRVGNQLQLVALNTGFRAAAGSPLQQAVRAVSDSLLASGTVASADHPERKSFLVDANALLLADVPGASTLIETAFRIPYALDRANSAIDRVRVTNEQTAVAVNLHFAVPKLPAPPATAPAPGTPRPTPPRAIPDPRSFFLGVQYRFAPLPGKPMPVRLADERVGYFVTEYRDLAADYSKDARTRVVHRWRLDRKDPAAALSEPEQPIVAYLDRNIPADLRPAVAAGVLEWNKAFEQAGFKEAIVVRQQPDDADWDVLEGRYLAVKWFVDSGTDGATAIGPSQVDPRTGEILHGSTLIPEQWARVFGRRFGESLPPRAQQGADQASHGHAPGESCTFAFDALEQASFAFELMVARGQLVRDSAQARAFVDAAVKSVVIHEVGHALGLRHNFKASAAVDSRQLQDRAFAAENGLAASIMDYVPANIPADDDRQVGAVLMTTVGAYDRWAIEFGYRQFADGEEAQSLQAIAARSAADARLAYATDEDAGGDGSSPRFPPGIDPLTNRFDLGADPLAYFDRQFKLARELWRRTEKRPLGADDDFRVFRSNLERGLYYIQTAAPGIVKYVGGVYVNRDRAGSGRPLLTPVEAAKQRDALKLLARELFAGDSFRFDPQFMRRLGIDQFARMEDGAARGPDFSLSEAVLRIQRGALDQLMSESLAQRLADAEPKVQDPRKLLSYAEVQSTLTDAVWSELRAGRDIDSLRRNLQREHLRRLTAALLRPTPAAATDVRPAHRAEALRLQAQLARASTSGSLNAVTRAHLNESLATLREALAAPLTRQGA
jgi:hypothetical protein